MFPQQVFTEGAHQYLALVIFQHSLWNILAVKAKNDGQQRGSPQITTAALWFSGVSRVISVWKFLGIQSEMRRRIKTTLEKIQGSW